MSGLSYLKYFFGISCFILAVVAATNYLVDPFGIYSDGEPWDFIHSRPDIAQMPNSHKAHEVELAKPDILLLGTSRVAEGFDPASPALPSRNAYNLGLYGGDVYKSWRFLQHASASYQPSIVLLGVDIGMFSATGRLHDENIDFSESRLKVGPNGQPAPFYRWADVTTLISFATFESSLETLWRSKEPAIQFKRGFEENYPAMKDGLGVASRVLAANRRWLNAAKASAPARDANGRNPQMEAVDAIGAFCAHQHIRLIVFVLPVHAQMLDKFTVDWNYYGAWMKALTASLAAHPSLRWEFWDFAGYNAVSTEPFPLITETSSSMHYYWEASHFRKAVGDLVLMKIFQDKGPPSFGLRVTPATVEADVARLKAEKEAWHNRSAVSPP